MSKKNCWLSRATCGEFYGCLVGNCSVILGIIRQSNKSWGNKNQKSSEDSNLTTTIYCLKDHTPLCDVLLSENILMHVNGSSLHGMLFNPKKHTWCWVALLFLFSFKKNKVRKLIRAAANCLEKVKNVSLTSSYASRDLHSILRELNLGSKHELLYSFSLLLVTNSFLFERYLQLASARRPGVHTALKRSHTHLSSSEDDDVDEQAESKEAFTKKRYFSRFL